MVAVGQSASMSLDYRKHLSGPTTVSSATEFVSSLALLMAP
ncbi:predicted protein [Plenodomus lingam JN3]|uniref:Predicted protein n=1 Tax=Leptosphaeria maculans (strain JN3 / isolate v23.1.3 / race Av1-4-5-6-7-8) TaxID=985895 RepID=E4ZW41_LEPMJ|nr:predicted protein [Plenodomus lingam JN3]CBX95817.1 predicted protein [Plenodomus lingam JN3]